MAAQLTLFGKVSKVAPYLKVAKDEYQKFVNKSWEINYQKYATKQEFIKFALKEWTKIRETPKALQDFMDRTPPPPPKRFRSLLTPNSPIATVNPPLANLHSASISHSEKLINESTTANISSSHPSNSEKIPNVPTSILSREEYLNANENHLIWNVLSKIGAKNLEDFFTDEVISDQSLMKTLASFAYSVDTFGFLVLLP